MHTVALSWIAPTTDASGNPVAPDAVTGYRVYRSVAIGGPFVSIANTGFTPSFADTDLADGTYFYQVTAKNIDLVESSPCAPIQVVLLPPPAALLSPPTSLAAVIL